MIVAIMGLTGSGKSTVAAVIAAKCNMLLFDMENEFPDEYRERRLTGEVVPAEDVKSYQRKMVKRMLDYEKQKPVVMAGFFLDKELPHFMEEHCSVIWINLVTDDKALLADRIKRRTNHFSVGMSVLEDNWPTRADQVIGTHCVRCDKGLDEVISECLSIICQ